MTPPALLVAALLAVLAALAVLLVRGRLRDRLHRADERVRRTWDALDAALVGRAEHAVARAGAPGGDPVTALLVADAAGAALDPTLDRTGREQAESDLTSVLVLAGLVPRPGEAEQVVLRRRLHNDAVRTARALRARPGVRLLRPGAPTGVAEPFEMAEPGLGWRA